MEQTNYDRTETEFLLDGFTNGFDIGYRGVENRQSTSKNIPFTVGDKVELWNKIMKEVEAGRYAGPFDGIPFQNYIQSPVGLVPKAGHKTRLIFHLSYRFSDEENGKSVNECTPKEWCSVKYNDLDAAVAECLRIGLQGKRPVYIGKTDLTSAFRVLPLKVRCFCWLVLKAEDPLDGKFKYFIDKCLPFGASISCSHYQRFSNALKHIAAARTNLINKAITNYLDDFLFLALTKIICDGMIKVFLQVCEELNVPVAAEKTEWSDLRMIFLGILMDGKHHVLCIPVEKKDKALRLINEILAKRKATIKQLQVLTRFLNFLFLFLLTHFTDVALCRPMVDLSSSITAEQLFFYSDASAAKTKGIGAVFNKHWLFARWEPGYIEKYQPSIEYLELYGLVAAMLTWDHLIRNNRVIVHCDNSSVVSMINNTSSTCGNCMYLIRLLTLNYLVNNRRVFAKRLRSEANYLSDALSRMQIDRFWRLAPPRMNPQLSKISPLVWPASRIWQEQL